MPFFSCDGRSTFPDSFSSTKGLQKALALEELPSGSGVLEADKQQPVTVRGDEMAEGEEGEEEEEEGGGGREENNGGGGGEQAPDDENR